MGRSELLLAWLGHGWLDPTWVWLVRAVVGCTSNGGAGLGIPCLRLGWSTLCSCVDGTIGASVTRKKS